MGILIAPPIEQNLGNAICNIVAIPVRYEKQVRSCSNPNSAKSDFDPAYQIQILSKDCLRLELPIRVLVFKNKNSVGAFLTRLSNGVGLALRDP